MSTGVNPSLYPEPTNAFLCNPVLSSIASCLLGILAAHLLFLAREQGVDGRVQLVATLEEVELEYEDVLHDLAAEFLDKCASGGCRATCIR